MHLSSPQSRSLRDRLADAHSEVKERKERAESISGRAELLGETPQDKEWRRKDEAREKQQVRNLEEAADYIQTARSAVDTGRSPLASPMTNFKKRN